MLGLALSLSTSGELLSRRAWYRVCQNCSSASVCNVRTTLIRHAGELADPSLPSRSLRPWHFPVTSKLQVIAGEKERRKRRVRNCAGDYGRRNIVADAAVARERVARNARCRSQESFGV